MFTAEAEKNEWHRCTICRRKNFCCPKFEKLYVSL